MTADIQSMNAMPKYVWAGVDDRPELPTVIEIEPGQFKAITRCTDDELHREVARRWHESGHLQVTANALDEFARSRRCL